MMKTFREFVKEAMMTVGSNPPGFSSTAVASGPVAGYTPFFFPKSEDDLSQDYQTPGQSGLAKWRFSNVWPVEKLTMAGIDKMTQAGQEYTDLMNQHTQEVIRKNFKRFMGYSK